MSDSRYNYVHNNKQMVVMGQKIGGLKDLVNVTIRFNKHDLAYVDQKATRYGMTRSAFIKFLSLNGELTVDMPSELRKPLQ